MPTETEELRTHPEVEEEEQEGGPVKPFLDHLEDLRWVLIKSLTALFIAMVLCLIAGNRLVHILERPLKKAKIKYPEEIQVVKFMFGTNRLGVFNINTKFEKPFPLSTNSSVELQLVPIQVGTNWVLSVHAKEGIPGDRAQPLQIDLTNLGPVGAFVVAFKGALYGGCVLAAPFIFYFVAGFVFPALRMHEKHYVYRGLGFGVFLFMLGVAFCYFILMPLALSASVAYSHWLGFTVTQWRAEEYISFVCKFMLGMGIGFELPVIILTLVKIGVLNYRILSKGRRYMIVINLILGAVLTTPEVLTQVMMAIPLQILYEITVWITWYWEKRASKRAAA